MWHTSMGDRTLAGAEAQLVVQACEQLVDMLESEVRDQSGLCNWETGITLFDDQMIHQRIALLDRVCRYLLADTESSLELNAELEATVMAIFESAKSCVQFEIDHSRCFHEPSCDCRAMVLSACLDVGPRTDDLDDDTDDTDEFPDVWCDDIEHWDWVIESLADRVLWDRDFEMASMIVDEDPETAEAYKKVLGIEQDYFSIAPPEVGEGEALTVLDELRKFLGFPSARRKPR